MQSGIERAFGSDLRRIIARTPHSRIAAVNSSHLEPGRGTALLRSAQPDAGD